GREASWAAGGILAPQIEADKSNDFFHLACTSRDLYRDFASDLRKESGIDVELDLTGTLCVAFTAAEERELRSRYDWQRGAGLERRFVGSHRRRRLVVDDRSCKNHSSRARARPDALLSSATSDCPSCNLQFARLLDSAGGRKIAGWLDN